MKKRKLKLDDVVQINPGHKFSGALAIVSMPKEFGCVATLLDDALVKQNNQPFISLEWAQMEVVAKAFFKDQNIENIGE